MIYFLVPAAHDFCIQDYLELHGAALSKDFCVLHTEDLVPQKEFAPGMYVFSAMDQLNAANFQLLTEIHRQLKDVPGFRFLNNPTTLQRLDLLRELNRQGLNDFRAVRAGEDPVDVFACPLLTAQTLICTGDRTQAVPTALQRGLVHPR